MKRIRTIITYKNYFEDFLRKQPVKVQDKIYKILEIIEFQQRVPLKYLKHIEGTEGLYEVRISLSTDIWRIFCFFDKGKLIILLNGFQKKTQKTPKNERSLALRLQEEYYKDNSNGLL